MYKFRVPKNEHLDLLCLISKKLYNQANWYVRQDFFHLENWLTYQDLNFILQDTDNYKLLKAQSSQQLLRVVEKNWKSFFKAIKEWRVNRSKFNGRPAPPRYKKEGYKLVIFTNQNSKISKDKIILTMSSQFKKAFPEFAHALEISIPQYKNKSFKDYQQVRILPRKKCYEVEIVYNPLEKKRELDKNKYLSIDFGLNNLITAVENGNSRPFIISGRILKSINQHWNKRKARLHSIKDKQEIQWTDQLDTITITRNDRVRDYMHKTARFIVEYCVNNEIGTICLGDLKNIKKNIRMGRQNNQNFVTIPIQKLKQIITYKAQLVGIHVEEVDESYTSKCSSLDLEPIQKREIYIGKRIKRGVFRGSNFLLNADVNGALNIMRKVIGDDFIKTLSDRGCWFQPVRIRDVFQTSHEQYFVKMAIVS
ncbi:MAG: transposase [Candidatus Lokiarchaeota archaeon]|nr:transposase [Candidatus Lokiarchaeota archaeon]